MKIWNSICALILLFDSSSFGNEKIAPNLARALPSLSPNDPVVVWIFFSDKGSHEALRRAVPNSVVSERSLQRRRKVRSELVDYSDLPVEKTYIDQLVRLGVKIRQVTKWFNGVSIQATVSQLNQIEVLPFVRSIDLVWRAKREKEIAHDPTSYSIPFPGRSNQPDDLDYGLSLGQVSLINVPVVHNTGNYGQGVIVGSFDNGFRLLQHEAFDSLRPRIVATYDFVDHKVSVVPNNPSPAFGAHGIVTLSALAGYKPGQLIGPAFGANFILARTENDSSETPIEEDNWLAAIEWADSIGVDVTSTSLGYLAYDPPYTSWTWENMNGNTTLITRAADMAAGRGIVVVNSAGNNGFNTDHNTLNAPADGDSAFTIGAANPDGSRAGFSSVGPTTSVPPRIKPDVMAQGTAVWCASPTDSTQYTYSGGTSLSCPLAAGAVALMLHAKPDATPMQVLAALRATASQTNNPDNLMGWGVIDAAAAIDYLLQSSGGFPTEFTLRSNYPNPFPTPSNPSTTISFSLPERAQVTMRIFNTLGQEVRTLLSQTRYAGTYHEMWDGKNNTGNDVASGVYICGFMLEGVSGRTSVKSIKISVIR